MMVVSYSSKKKNHTAMLNTCHYLVVLVKSLQLTLLVTGGMPKQLLYWFYTTTGMPSMGDTHKKLTSTRNHANPAIGKLISIGIFSWMTPILANRYHSLFLYSIREDNGRATKSPSSLGTTQVERSIECY
jgi:hypothetical protein